MHIYLAKSSRFESTDFASVMIDDVGCSRRHQCPQCEYIRHATYGVNVSLLVYNHRTYGITFIAKILFIHNSEKRKKYNYVDCDKKLP